jgi:hypothetical protein
VNAYFKINDIYNHKKIDVNAKPYEIVKKYEEITKKVNGASKDNKQKNKNWNQSRNTIHFWCLDPSKQEEIGTINNIF